MSRRASRTAFGASSQRNLNRGACVQSAELMVDEKQIKKILSDIRRIAVVGCSKDPAKDAHRVPKYMQMNGYRIIPGNPTAAEILAGKPYPSLAAAPIPFAAVGALNFAVVTASYQGRSRTSGTIPTRNGLETPRSSLTFGLIPENACTGTSIQLDPS